MANCIPKIRDLKTGTEAAGGVGVVRMGVKRSFNIRQLKPFHCEAESMPKPGPENIDQLAELDPDLLPEERAYVNHYLGYADILLREEESEEAATSTQSRNTNIIELPRMQELELQGTQQSRQECNGANVTKKLLAFRS